MGDSYGHPPQPAAPFHPGGPPPGMMEADLTPKQQEIRCSSETDVKQELLASLFLIAMPEASSSFFPCSPRQVRTLKEPTNGDPGLQECPKLVLKVGEPTPTF